MTAKKKGAPGQALAPPARPSQDLLAQANNAMASPGASIMGKISPTSPIYMGMTKSSMTGPGRDIGHGQAMSKTMAYQDARLLPTMWSQSQLSQFVTNGIMKKIPGFNVNMGMPEIISAWDDLVVSSFEFSRSSGGQKWTPQDVLDSYSQSGTLGTVKQGDWLVDAATGNHIKYIGPKSKTQTSSNVDLSSAEDVRALTTQVLTQALGRAPTTKEVAQYKSTINAQEEANPSLSTTTQTFNDQGEVSNQSTQTTGGFDAAAQQQLVQDQAAKTPEYAKYQSGTTYWNAMMQLLTGG